MKDGVPDYTLNRNRTISPSSPAEYIPRGPRIEKQPAEVNSACTKVLAFGQNTCTAQKRRGPEGRFSEMLYLFRMHMPKSRLSAAAESLLFV